MKKTAYKFLILGILIVASVGFLVAKKVQAPPNNSQPITLDGQANNLQQPEIYKQQNSGSQEIQKSQAINIFNNAKARVTKKPFGIFITPKASPVQPERFSGYHTGADLEINPDELNVAVAVSALCDGRLLVARNASGYGGVAVESCVLENQPVTVVYGHIDLSSIKSKVGDQLSKGEFLANLGDAYSSRTDGERKHLHLAIHKGNAVNILGYVQAKSQLGGWIDPMAYLGGN